MGRPCSGIAVVAFSVLAITKAAQNCDILASGSQQSFTAWIRRIYHHQALVLWPRPLRHRVICDSVKTAIAFLEEATSQACAARRLHELSASAPGSGPSAVLQHANAPAAVSFLAQHPRHMHQHGQLQPRRGL